LTFKVKNTSRKAIIHISMEIVFYKLDPLTAEKKPGLNLVLGYGSSLSPEERLDRNDAAPARPIPPDGTVDLVLDEDEMTVLRAAQQRFNLPASFEEIQVDIHAVIFEDDEIWTIGAPAYRDPKKPGRWVLR
jgi:hypothetical protein